MEDFSQVTWRKSSHSASNGTCVEVGQWRKSSRSTQQGTCVEAGSCGCHAIAVRDSKNPDNTPLTFTHGRWAAFTEDLKAGMFDRT